MVRVTCHSCEHSWNFKPRAVSWLLKRSYKVKCPKCGEPVFLRVKRKLKQPAEVKQ